jgi:hypothetical protein
MVKTAPSLSSFTAGELSERLSGRVSLTKYREGLSELTNFLIMPQGGVTRRPGTEFLGEVQDSDKITRLIPFQFKTSDTYILEFGDQIMRVYRLGQQVLEDSSGPSQSGTFCDVDRINNSNPCTVEIDSNNFGTNASQFKAGSEIFFSASSISGSNGEDLGDAIMGRNYLIKSFDKPGGSSETVITISDLHGKEFDATAFSSDYFGGGDMVMKKIYELTSPYPSSVLNEINYAQSADTMYLVHPSYAIRALTRTGHNAWSLTTPSLTSAANSMNGSSDNYPSVVTFFEQRLVFGATNNYPQTLWFSKNGDYTNFTVGTNADDALTYTIASNQVNAIRWLSATRVLVVGTTGGEYVVTSGSGPITPTTTLIRKYSNYGSAAHTPVQVADVTLFLQRNKRKVREFRYVGDVDDSGYQAPDMTILAEHITKGGIEEFAYQQEPDSVVWGRRSDGILVAMTYRREEQVVAWHKHVIGGRFGDCTITVSDYANIAVGTQILLTLSTGTVITLQSEAAGSSSPSARSGNTIFFRPYQSNNTTADNIYTALNAESEFTVANPSAAVVTVEETSPSRGYLTASSTDKVRLVVASQSHAIVESIATLPTDSGEDELYMIVKRTIKGVTKRYVERLRSIDFGDETHEGWFLDCGLSYPTAWPTPDYVNTVTTLGGLYHLEGENVQVAGNGAAHADLVVTTGTGTVTMATSGSSFNHGNITTSFSVSSLVAGYGYNSILQTNRLESGSEDGTSQGKPKRVHGVTVRLLNTVGLEIGPDSSTLESIAFRTSSMAASEAVSLYTGDKEVEFTGTYYENDKLYIRQTQPLPLTVLAIYPRLTTFDI